MNRTATNCQPCDTFIPGGKHDCYGGCPFGVVETCQSCGKDHHSDGWQTCPNRGQRKHCRHPACVAVEKEASVETNRPMMGMPAAEFEIDRLQKANAEKREAIAALRAECDTVTKERDEAREWVRKMHSERQILTCVYCGHAYPPGTAASGSDVLTEHIRVCASHPLRVVEQERDTARAEAIAERESAAALGRGIVELKDRAASDARDLGRILEERDEARAYGAVLRSALAPLAAYVDGYEYGRAWAGRPHALMDAARAVLGLRPEEEKTVPLCTDCGHPEMNHDDDGICSGSQTCKCRVFCDPRAWTVPLPDADPGAHCDYQAEVVRDAEGVEHVRCANCHKPAGAISQALRDAGLPPLPITELMERVAALADRIDGIPFEGSKPTLTGRLDSLTSAVLDLARLVAIQAHAARDTATARQMMADGVRVDAEAIVAKLGGGK